MTADNDFRQWLKERFLRLEEKIDSNGRQIRAELGAAIEANSAQIANHVQQAKREADDFMKKNSEQDTTLENHEKRISKLEKYWWVILIVIPGGIAFIYGVIALIKAVSELLQ